MTVTLNDVLLLFPAGTSVDAYLDAIDDSGEPRPIGPSIDNAVVAGEGSLTFDDLASDGTLYVLGALLDGHWRLLRVATPAPEPEASTALLERIEAIEASIVNQVQVVFFAEDLATARPAGAASVIWVGVGVPDDFLGGQDLLLNEPPP